MLPVLLPPKCMVQIVKFDSGEDIQILLALSPELKSKPPFNPERISSVHVQYHNLGSNARIIYPKNQLIQMKTTPLVLLTRSKVIEATFLDDPCLYPNNI